MKLKHLATTILLAIACCSCANTSNVNILITNLSNHDTTNVEVRVPMSEVMKHLNMQPTDTLLVLNERNHPVDFSYSSDGNSIVFMVPSIKLHSQKNFSINKSRNELSDNLFRFRTASITVEVK
ncbi:MAG: hypothetical protein II445_04445 [Muribaculaceae bacterium]|nr:hypothetical protein [Muribaculaceae bacterium]